MTYTTRKLSDVLKTNFKTRFELVSPWSLVRYISNKGYG